MQNNIHTTPHTFSKLNALGIAGIIFDYGGTLDTNGNHWGQVIWHAYQRADIPVSEADYRSAYVHVERTLATHRIIMPQFTFADVLSTKLKMQLAYLRDEKGLNVPQLELDMMHDILLTFICDDLDRVIQHSFQVLLELQKHYPQVLVSNFYGNIEAVLDNFQLRQFFGSIIESSVVGVRKPDPQIFALGVEALKLPADKVLVVGDSFDKDIVPASSLGCKTAWFKGEQWEEKTYNEALPQLIIQDLDDLLG